VRTALAQEIQDRPPDLYFAGTDGWIHLPPTPAIPPFHPDDLAPDPFTTYIFGFRNLTGMTPEQVAYQKGRAQHTAPMWWITEGTEFHVMLTNLGLVVRPDLFDSHTIHFHGFRDVIPFFDGEPHGSISVPTGKHLTYVYRPHEPGTYMYHCHVEDVEHVQQGMAGPLFVRPAANPKWAYNDASTAFHREFALFLTDFWAEAHWSDAHIQVPEWSDYHVDFAMINGRTYPDTLAPNASIDPFNPVRDPNGDLIPPQPRPGDPPGAYDHLKYQPLSSLIRCNAGDDVLLRLANLGYFDPIMTLSGIKMRIVGKDATFMRGRDGTDTSFWTSSVPVHVGASYDAIFTAPPFQGPGTYDPEIDAYYDTYPLYNRDYHMVSNLQPGGFGGQRTEVRVYPADTLPEQTVPNT
jgi:FtsP/CotA-like multicopper oxidase with cupredoxin domain